MLCYVVLCCAVLCCVVLCCVAYASLPPALSQSPTMRRFQLEEASRLSMNEVSTGTPSATQSLPHHAQSSPAVAVTATKGKDENTDYTTVGKPLRYGALTTFSPSGIVFSDETTSEKTPYRIAGACCLYILLAY